MLRNAHRIRAYAYLSLRDPGPALADAAPVLRQARAALRHRLAQRVLPPTSILGGLLRAFQRRLPTRRAA